MTSTRSEAKILEILHFGMTSTRSEAKFAIWRYVFRENDPKTIIFSARIRGICVFVSKCDSYSEGEKVLTLVRFDNFLRIEFPPGKS